MDADRKKIVWDKLYSKVYTYDEWELWKYLDFSDLKGKNQAPVIKNIDAFNNDSPSAELAFAMKYKDIFRVSGDTDITLKESHSNYKRMHCFPNFSLMPCTGGMNDAKGTKPFVSFIKVVDDYYKDQDIKKIYREVGRRFKDPTKQQEMIKCRQECLRDFMNLIGKDVYDYCRKMYFISERQFVDEILKANNDDAIMDNYWEKRIEIMVLKGVDRNLMEEDINDPLYR